MSDAGAVERAARALSGWSDDLLDAEDGPNQTAYDMARAALAAAAPTVGQVAEVLGEVLWRRQSDVLERRAFAFSDAPSQMHYLAHGRALAKQVAALWGAR